jgi:hypothetical protein
MASRRSSRLLPRSSEVLESPLLPLMLDVELEMVVIIDEDEVTRDREVPDII